MMTHNAGLHVAVNGWFAGDATSGTGQYTNHLLQHLPQARADLRISLLAPAHVAAQSAMANLPPAVTIVPIALPRLPENLAKLWFEQVSVPRAVQRLRADVLWTPYWAAPWRQPAPTVVTVHDLIPLLLPHYRGGLAQRGYTWLVGRTARRAAAVIAVSHATADDIAEHLHIPREQHPCRASRPQPGRRRAANCRGTGRRCAPATICRNVFFSIWAGSTCARTCPVCSPPIVATSTRAATPR
jgi:hypothetical protein